MFKNLTKAEIITILLTSIAMIVSITAFLATLKVGQDSLKSRIESLERGTKLDENKEKAIQEFMTAANYYNSLEIPVGTIIPYFGKDLPKGYLLCDGSKFTRSTAPRLFDLFELQFPEYIVGEGVGSLPNLKGMFLRGAGRVIENGEISKVGRLENASVGPHTHFYFRITDVFASQQQGNPPTGWAEVPAGKESHLINSGEGGDKSDKYGLKLRSGRVETTDPSNSGKETRPANVSIRYLIKI